MIIQSVYYHLFSAMRTILYFLTCSVYPLTVYLGYYYDVNCNIDNLQTTCSLPWLFYGELGCLFLATVIGWKQWDNIKYSYILYLFYFVSLYRDNLMFVSPFSLSISQALIDMLVLHILCILIVNIQNKDEISIETRCGFILTTFSQLLWFFILTVNITTAIIRLYYYPRNILISSIFRVATMIDLWRIACVAWNCNHRRRTFTTTTAFSFDMVVFSGSQSERQERNQILSDNATLDAGDASVLIDRFSNGDLSDWNNDRLMCFFCFFLFGVVLEIPIIGLIDAEDQDITRTILVVLQIISTLSAAILFLCWRCSINNRALGKLYQISNTNFKCNISFLLFPIYFIFVAATVNDLPSFSGPNGFVYAQTIDVVVLYGLLLYVLQVSILFVRQTSSLFHNSATYHFWMIWFVIIFMISCTAVWLSWIMFDTTNNVLTQSQAFKAFTKSVLLVETTYWILKEIMQL